MVNGDKSSKLNLTVNQSNGNLAAGSRSNNNILNSLSNAAKSGGGKGVSREEAKAESHKSNSY
jgi:hypothetical protein